jgi:hypothetical protein
MRLIARVIGILEHIKSKHYKGLPPDLTAGKDLRTEMKPAAVVVIEDDQDGVFLYRYDAQANCVGDTWHQNLDEAKGQAQFEFENILSEWVEIPLSIQGVQQVVQFGLGLFPDKSSEREWLHE